MYFVVGKEVKILKPFISNFKNLVILPKFDAITSIRAHSRYRKDRQVVIVTIVFYFSENNNFRKIKVTPIFFCVINFSVILQNNEIILLNYTCTNLRYISNK